MRINIYGMPRDDVFAFTAIHYRAYTYFKENAPEGVEIVLKDRDEEKKIRGIGDCLYGGCKFGPLYTIIENDETKKYIVISYWDKVADIVLFWDGTGWDVENCVEILTSTGVHDPRLPKDFTYTPFTFVVSNTHVEDHIEEFYNRKDPKIIRDKLRFKGLIYDFRQYLKENDDRFEVNHKDVFHRDYLDDLSTERISLGLYGAGETCPRDMEILGLGNVLLRKKFAAKFHNPLIPEYHYASVEYEDLLSITNAHIYWKNLADRYVEKFEQIKNDDEYLNFIAANGRAWYTENATIDANIRMMGKLVDFNKLT